MCVEGNQTLVERVQQGDCMQLVLQYVQDQANTLGAAALTVSCFLVRILTIKSISATQGQ